MGFTPREADPDLKTRLARGHRRSAGGIPGGVRDARRGRLHPRGDRPDARGPAGDLEGAALPGAGQAAGSAGRLREGSDHERRRRLDERLREAAQAYNAPPETPREEMWAADRGGRRAGGQAVRAGRGEGAAASRRRTWWAAGRAAAAAVLAVGIGIGRLSVAAGRPSALGRAARRTPTTYRLATQEHLSQSEAFLTLFRTSLQQRRRPAAGLRLGPAAARHQPAAARLARRDRPADPAAAGGPRAGPGARSRSSRRSREPKTSS